MNILKTTPKGMVIITKAAVDADFVSIFANSQQHLLTEIVKAEAASFRIEQASNITNEVFKNMLDTNFVDLENEEN